MSDRIAQISALLRESEDARHMVQGATWAKIWNEFEQELLKRLLDCDATEDEKRWRCQTMIESARRIRRIFETKAITPAGLETELAFLEGAKMRPIA